jgi:L-lactate utilization protein LutB
MAAACLRCSSCSYSCSVWCTVEQLLVPLGLRAPRCISASMLALLPNEQDAVKDLWHSWNTVCWHEQ